MGSLIFLFFPWGLILQAVAIVHFIRRRPDGYWLWIIIFFGGLGALIYIAAEVIPDAGLMRQSFKMFPRRRRIHELESAILDNPSAGIMRNWPTCIWKKGTTLEPGRVTTRRSHPAPTRWTRFIAEGWPQSSWATSPRPCPILNAL
jgi:hypothetical protein